MSIALPTHNSYTLLTDLPMIHQRFSETAYRSVMSVMGTGCVNGLMLLQCRWYRRCCSVAGSREDYVPLVMYMGLHQLCYIKLP